MKACPRCESASLVPIQERYDVEVRKADPDLDLLARIAPPTRRASIHGFILAVLVWIAGLAPFFAPPGGMLRTVLPLALLTLAWIPVFLHARRKDAERLADYRAREICDECGFSD
jgi:hypothetical protein